MTRPICHKLSQWLADTCTIPAAVIGGSKVILRYIKGTIHIGLVLKKDLQASRSISVTLILTTHETMTNVGLQWDMCLHYLKR